MKSQFLQSVVGLCIGVFLSTGTLYAQIIPTKINYSTPLVVNFKQLADYQLLHTGKTHRSIEQGEDRDKDFKFIPKPVPADAVTFPVTLPAVSSRATSPAPTASFNGVEDNGTLIPPDIEAAAVPTYVLETTNQQFNIYTKTGTLQSTLTITTLLSPTGGSGFFDPHVEYDANGGRFIIALDGTYSNGDGGIFIAVSQTSDPTGNWYVYSFDGIGDKTDFLDFPMLGFNANWIVVTGNDFIKGSSPVYAKIYVLNKADLYSGTEGTVTTFTDESSFSVCPAQTNDNSQTTEYLVEDWNGNSGGSGYVRLATVTGAVSSPAYALGSTLGVTSPWSETDINAKQEGNSNAINTDDTRIDYAVVSNGSMWFSHTAFLPATSPTYSGVDWWEINPATPSVTQYGRLAVSGTFYYYPCINVNSNGDALLDYSVSSSTQYAGSAYAFHASSDAANTMEGGYVFKAGVAGYYKTYGSGRNRWGDFSGVAVDPANNSFWASNEWANTSNDWATALANVPPSSSCTVATGETTSNIGTDSATFSWAAVSGAASYNVQYQVVGASTWTSASTTSTSYKVTGLTPGTNYAWQVQTVCSAGGSSAFSSSTDFTTTTPPCSLATGMGTTNIANNSATFGWTAVSGASSYNVQYQVVGASTWSTGTTSTNSYNASGLTAGTNYAWQVQTVCSDGGSSAYTASTDFTTTGTAPCNAPTGMTTGSITASSATLSWGAVSGAASYNMQYQVVGASTWTTASTTSTSYPISGLTASTNYAWQVQTVCSGGGTSSFTASTDFTTPAAVSYCSSKGSTASEYIHIVKANTISNTVSNDGGYGNYTNLSTNITAGVGFSVSVSPGFKSTTYTEAWTIFIDYNHTGTFELIAEGRSTGTVSGTISVPSTSVNGSTRMRIVMHRSTYETNACATFTNGDVQDYTVNISGGTASPVYADDGNTNAVTTLTGNNDVEAVLYPNPTNNMVTVHYTNPNNTNVKIEVISVTGQVVLTTLPQDNVQDVQLNVAELPAGVYFVRTIIGDDNVLINKLVKE